MCPSIVRLLPPHGFQFPSVFPRDSVIESPGILFLVIFSHNDITRINALLHAFRHESPASIPALCVDWPYRAKTIHFGKIGFCVNRNGGPSSHYFQSFFVYVDWVELIWALMTIGRFRPTSSSVSVFPAFAFFVLSFLSFLK